MCKVSERKREKRTAAGRDGKGVVGTGTEYESVHAICAYYESSDSNSITCEGLVPHTRCRMFFLRKMYKQAHFETYCAQMDCYKNCPHARALEAKYSTRGK